jgi:hypothetical protein
MLDKWEGIMIECPLFQPNIKRNSIFIAGGTNG